MSRRATQLTLILSLILCPAVSFARAPQVTQASAAAAEANAQAASAQASALQAVSQQAAAQVTTAQTAFREAMQNYTKAPAGAAKTAAQAAVQQAQKQLVAAQTDARMAATQAMAAHSAAAQAAAQAAAAQAALARQAAAAPAPAAQPPAAPTAASVSHASPATASTAGSSGSPAGKGSGSSGANSTLSTVLGSVFGNGGSGGGATTGSGKTAKNGTSNTPSNGSGNAVQTAPTQGNAFAASNNGTGRGAAQPETNQQQGAPAGPTRKAGAAFASGALGVGQSSDTLLTVYGCSRMGSQVICDTDLSNQNNSVTQVNSADQWKEVYLQDDAGDNHMRSMGVFENQNGDQRTSITLPYGEKSRYILVFNGVPANVKSVTLKSSKDTLDVEGITVANPDAPAAAQGAAADQPAPAGIQPASAPAGRTGSRPPHS